MTSSSNTDREALLDRIETAIGLAFEGEGEAWSDKLSGDRLAAVAARAIEPVLAAHDERVKAEAWDEGHAVKTARWLDGGIKPKNPYRRES
jgi:hypothetical protein